MSVESRLRRWRVEDAGPALFLGLLRLHTTPSLLIGINSEITPHHHYGETFTVSSCLYYSVGARRDGKHALQHAPRTVISQRKLQQNFQMELLTPTVSTKGYGAPGCGGAYERRLESPLEAKVELETCNSREGGHWHLFGEKQSPLVWTSKSHGVVGFPFGIN